MRHQPLAAALTGCGALLLAGCGGGSSTASGTPVTVTVTPTVTSTPPPAKTQAASSSSSTTPRGEVKSDVKGRGYDLGTATRVRTTKGVDVVTLDRFTWKGLDDARLATGGVPLGGFTGTPYTNQNTRLTYDIPLAENARVLYHHCVKAGEPLQTKSFDVKDLTGLASRENVLLVKLDEDGQAIAIDNLPGCPG